jgi:hypothetical protein
MKLKALVQKPESIRASAPSTLGVQKGIVEILGCSSSRVRPAPKLQPAGAGRQRLRTRE